MSLRLKTIRHGIYTKIPKAEIDKMLDAGKIYAKMTDGTYQQCRRNGVSKFWKTDPARIYIPFKHGPKGYGQITNLHLIHGDYLHPDYFRHIDDLQRS